jgi:hypothetical protein
MLIDFIDPKGTEVKTTIYGSTLDQRLAEKIQSATPAELRGYVDQQRELNFASDRSRREGVVDDFMRRYFRNRNRTIARPDGARRSGFAFLPSAPPLHMRFIEATNVYRDQAPIVEVRIRYRGRFYTGSQLLSIEDDVIHTIMIPEPR